MNHNTRLLACVMSKWWRFLWSILLLFTATSSFDKYNDSSDGRRRRLHSTVSLATAAEITTPTTTTTSSQIHFCTQEELDFCQDENNQIYDFNIYSEVYGNTSSCFVTDIVDDDDIRLCYETICVEGQSTTSSTKEQEEEDEEIEEGNHDLEDMIEDELVVDSYSSLFSIFSTPSSSTTTTSTTSTSVSISSSLSLEPKIHMIYRGEVTICEYDGQEIPLRAGTVVPVSLYCPQIALICPHLATYTPTTIPATPSPSLAPTATTNIPTENNNKIGSYQPTLPPKNLELVTPTSISTTTSTEHTQSSSSLGPFGIARPTITLHTILPSILYIVGLVL